MCDLHDKKIISRWFAYATNITETAVLNIGFSKPRDIAVTGGGQNTMLTDLS